MVIFPNCKINLGLHVVSKRPDGFHSIQTVFYPVNWSDALEVVQNSKNNKVFDFTQSGLPVNGDQEQNLIYQAWRLISEKRVLPPLRVHLHKNIPMGAGLGGGSSDAAHFINAVNLKFDLNFSINEKLEFAKQLGSDCAFFIQNEACYAEGKGDQMSNIRVNLNAYYILLVYPAIHCNTAEAYSALTPKIPKYDLRDVIQSTEIAEWKNKLMNDFEAAIFSKHPEIFELKESLYAAGALYASMSGSGSTVFGIFSKEPENVVQSNYSFFLQKPKRKIL